MEPITKSLPFALASSIAQTIVEEIEYAINGRNIAILGAAGTGKTKFYHLLQMITLYKSSPEATSYPIETQRGLITIPVGVNKIRKIRFKAAVDVPGNEKKDWSERVEKADIIFYLINAEELFKSQDDKLYKRIAEDLEDINRWIDKSKNKEAKISNVDEPQDKPANKSNKEIFIIGNFFDKVDQEYQKHYAQCLERFKKEIKEKLGKDYRIAKDTIIASLEIGGVAEIFIRIHDELNKSK